MTIDQHELDGATLIAPRGRIDSTTADALDAHLLKLPAGGSPAVILDFAGVEYISSAGLRVMLALAKRVRERKGRLALCALNDGVRQVFELAGFLPLFAIVGSREDAVRSVAGR